MSDVLSHTPLTDLPEPGRYGADCAEPGVVVRYVPRLALATLAARKAAGMAVAEAAAGLGVSLADAPRVSQGPDLSFIGLGPGRWLVAGAGAPDAMVPRLATAFAGIGAVSDQSDGYVVMDVFGPRVADALAKLVPLDLHATAFGPGHAAATLVALIPLTFWQLDASPAYRFAVPRSFAPAFLRALAAASGEYGLEVAGAARG